MTIQDIHTTYACIIDQLDQASMKGALDALTHLIVATGKQQFLGQADELQSTYRYMLHYYVEGFDDPQRSNIRDDIRRRAYELADAVRHEALGDISPTYYYALRRVARYQSSDIPTILQEVTLCDAVGEREQHELTAVRLFDQVYTTGFLNPQATDALSEALRNPSYPADVKTLIISALLLALQASFDRNKVRLLFDAAALTDAISLQALVALCLTLDAYSTRLALYPEIHDRLEALAETPNFRRRLCTVIIRFILTRETEKVAHRMQNDIIPEIMKFTTRGGKVSARDFLNEIAGEEMNPEWMERMMSSSDKLSGWMREYSEMQEEGIDLLHSAFGSLKRFPFFQELSNWFLPFTPQHTTFRGLPIEDGLKELMRTTPFMCDSDKYSLCISMLYMPEQQRHILREQLQGDVTQLREQEAAELNHAAKLEERSIGLYIRNLYRFYKLHPSRTDFSDIFNRPLDFHRLSILRPYLSDAEMLLHIAEVYLRKGYPDDARPIYQELIERGEGDSEMLHQKLGYCLQMAGDIAGALREYLRAEMINPDSKWLLRRIATCYRALKQPAEAVKFLLRHDRLEPDNLSVLLHIGHCYLEQQQYDEALKYYFKVEYLDPSNTKARRGVAWCSFVVGKYDQARTVYRKLIADHPQPEDYLNAGHTEWAMRNIKGAVAHYQQAIAGEDFQTFTTHFDADRPALLRAGITPDEVAMMLDELRYATTE